jgi:signal transduction histidine kinase
VALAEALCDDCFMAATRVTLVVLAGAVLGFVAYRAQIDNLGEHTTPTRSLATLAYAWTFLVAGLAAWLRRPRNRLGPMMIVVGCAMLLRQLRYSDDDLVFTTFFVLGELAYALFVHTVLAYPAGVVLDRVERLFVRCTYAIAVGFPLAMMLFYDGSRPLRYYGPRARDSVLTIDGAPGLVDALQQTYAVVAYGAVASILILLILRRLVQATPRARRQLAPLLVAAAVAPMRAVFDAVLTFDVVPPAWVQDNLFWWQVAGLIAVPLALLAGLLRSRLAHGTVAELVVQLQRTPQAGIRDELAAALGDPSLELFFWLPERGEFVDADGTPATLPTDDGARAITRLEHDGIPLAALVHDPTLLDEPELVEAAGAAARLALVNARLHAEVQAQLAKVTESRARIVAAGDEQRRRIERDLHDGAQVQLVALALELKRAQRDVSDPQLERLLASTATELQTAVEQLRELAHGLHPPLLVQSGLGPALTALADRAPIPVVVDADVGRFAADLEAAAYFVVSEALANVAKHANASRAHVTVRLVEDTLVVTIEDDGIGGVSVDGGSGLRGLLDRIEAHGGRLAIESAPGKGTRITAEIPCAS